MSSYGDYLRAAQESGNPEQFVQDYVSPVEYSASVGHNDIPMSRTSNAEPINNQLANYVAPRPTVNTESEFYKRGQAARNGTNYSNNGSDYSGGNSSNGSSSGGETGNGQVYGSPRYGGRTENTNVTGKEWNQPGTGFGTGNFLGKALEDIQSNQEQSSGTAPVYGTPGYRGVPTGGITQGTEWNQPGTGFGTGNFAGDYGALIDLMRNGNTLEEAQAILNNQNELAAIQAGNDTTTQPYSGTPRADMNDVGAAANSAHFNTYRDRFNPREDAYFKQMQNDFANARKQFPNYSYSALADIVLFNNEMKNGQDSYYKWLANRM